MRMIETLLGLRALFPYKVEGMEALKEKNGLTTSRGFPAQVSRTAIYARLRQGLASSGTGALPLPSHAGNFWLFATIAKHHGTKRSRSPVPA